MSDPYPSAPSYQPGNYQPMAAPAGYGMPPPSGYGQPTYAPAQPAQFNGLGVEAAYPQQQGYSAAGAAQGPAGYSQVHVPLYQANVGPCAAGGGHSIKEEFTVSGNGGREWMAHGHGASL